MKYVIQRAFRDTKNLVMTVRDGEDEEESFRSATEIGRIHVQKSSAGSAIPTKETHSVTAARCSAQRFFFRSGQNQKWTTHDLVRD